MTALILCVLAFLCTFVAAKKSLWAGLVFAAGVGYLYGILRANLLAAASHFIFDASLAGLYLASFNRFFDNSEKNSSALRLWIVALMGWPCLLFLLPFQPFLVSLVGLRGNIFFIPVLLLGSRLRPSELRLFACGLAALNLLALGFGVLEYFRGIEPFFPRSPVTSIIYSSADVAGGHYRIPAIFTSAHGYASTMVASIPFLYAAWIEPSRGGLKRMLLFAGMGAAFCGVLLASTRTFVVMASFLVIVIVFGGGMTVKKQALWLIGILCLGSLALTNERFQRFKSLSDSDMVVERIAGSVNRSFFEILMEHPMGNGLGGGGTSLPYFLQSQVQSPIGGESEFTRILAEQGIIGLSIWIGFLLWCIIRRTPFLKHPARAPRRVIWCWYSVSFVTSAIGVGLLTAIPSTFLMLLAVGWTVVVPAREVAISKARSPLRRVGTRPYEIYSH